MICPRCGKDDIVFMVKSPKGDVWSAYICNTCCYSYRDTEPAENKERELYDERFRIDPDKIDSCPIIPPIPKLI
ncbi:MAG: hypothetical protein LBI42_01440 [Chitinispirillales bacterium]|jgi:protein-arginine kinase activator protein McsA|nr:hypothetical protein [Chitinispirillales bacterium]